MAVGLGTSRTVLPARSGAPGRGVGAAPATHPDADRGRPGGRLRSVDVRHWFPTSGGIGPLGVAFPTTGGVLVSDYPGNLRLFPTDTDGQNAANIDPIKFGGSNAIGLAELDGTIYMSQQSAADVVQLINNGASTQAIVSGIPGATGVLADPFNNLLYVDRGASAAPIYVVDPVAKTANVFQNIAADGLSLSADGKTLYAAIEGARQKPCPGLRHHDQCHGFRLRGDRGRAGWHRLGQRAGGGKSVRQHEWRNSRRSEPGDGGPDHHCLGRLARDFVTVDPNDGTLLVTQSDRIMRLVPGVFAIPQLTTTTTLDVSPETSSFGQTVTLTAVVATAGTGTPTGTVTFLIDGQAQTPVGLTEVGGFDQATFTTSSLMLGTHAITATYSGDTTFASSGSNQVSVTDQPRAGHHASDSDAAIAKRDSRPGIRGSTGDLRRGCQW